MATKSTSQLTDLPAASSSEPTIAPPPRFNGINNNYIPTPRSPILLPEMDRFEVDDSELDVVVLRKSRNASEDLGTADAYTLRSMLRSGFDPSTISINTRSVSRLDGISQLDKFSAAAESLFSDTPIDKSKIE